MSYVNYILFFFLVSFLMIGGELYQHDKDLGITRDIYNYTESTIVLPDINISENHPIERTRGVVNEGRLYKIIDSFINFLMVSAEQTVKMGVEFGYQHGDLDFKVIWEYLIIILTVIIIVTLIKPIGYLIILLILFGIWIKDKIVKRKKRRLKENE